MPTGTTLLTASSCANTNLSFPSSFWCNPSSIDGLGITDSSQGGGGIFVHGWGHNLEIANNRIYNNTGTFSGGVTVGQALVPPANIMNGLTANAAPGSCYNIDRECPLPNNTQEPYCFDVNVKMHNNYITLNASIGDVLFTGTPSGRRDLLLHWFRPVQVRLQLGVRQHEHRRRRWRRAIGFAYDGEISHNSILFNQSADPTLTTNGGGILVMGAPDVLPLAAAHHRITSCPVLGLTDGIGPGLVINANLIMGNAAESGSGGGLRLQNINGSDVVTFATNPSLWYSVR